MMILGLVPAPIDGSQIFGIQKHWLLLANAPATEVVRTQQPLLSPHPEILEEAMEKNRDEQGKEQVKRNPPADDSESRLNDQDPGERQKENQNQQKDDPLAA